MPSWTHLLIGFAVVGAALFGLSKVSPASPASPKLGPAGGGANLRTGKATVDGRDYIVIDRGFGTFEVLSPDDSEAWIIFDASAAGDTVRPIASGARGEDVVRDMQKFPKNVFGGDYGPGRLSYVVSV